MTDREIDALLSAANPLDERALAELPLGEVERELRDAILCSTDDDVAAAAPRSRRRRRAIAGPARRGERTGIARRPARRRVLAGFALAVLAVIASVSIAGRDGGGSGTAWAAPLVRLAEASPLLLLDQPGWKVSRADEYGDGEGEMTFTRGAGDRVADDGSPIRRDSADLHWRRGAIEMWLRDRAKSSSRVVQRTVLGRPAQISQYSGTTDFTAIWSGDGGRVLEFRAVTADLAGFEALLASLRRVDVDAWLSAMPASVVKSADRAAVVREMLAGIPLPPAFDAASIEQAPSVSERYQLGAKVAGAVACGWFERWSAARARGDAAATREAVNAMQTSRGWKILREMDSDGDYPEVLWGYADAMAAGQATSHGRPLMAEVRGGLGCPGK